MNKNTYKNLELAGTIICVLIWYFVHSFNAYEEGHLIKIIFSSVNGSIWESIKIFLFALVLWSGVELCWAKPELKGFVITKTLLLYLCGGVYCLVVPCFYITGVGLSPVTEVLCVSAFSVVFHFLSYRAVKNKHNFNFLFIPCLLLLVVFSLLFMCFTPYPPNLPAFYDFQQGYYGIRCTNIDKGALFLDRLYGI